MDEDTASSTVAQVYRAVIVMERYVTPTGGYGVFNRAVPDTLAAYPHVDANRIAFTGLSGGGWQSIVISSLDTRVALTDRVAGFQLHHQSTNATTGCWRFRIGELAGRSGACSRQSCRDRKLARLDE